MRGESFPESDAIATSGKHLAFDMTPAQVLPEELHRLLQSIRDEISMNADNSFNGSPKRSLLADLEFEKTLRRVRIPAISEMAGISKTKHIDSHIPDHAREIFQWLQSKGVRQVVEVHITDSFHKPHAEETIIETLKGFNVQELDWKRTDLSVDTILQTSQDVKTLHLYSSGNWSALAHWLSIDGIPKLPLVRIANSSLSINSGTANDTLSWKA
jgi:hypothetical protein